MNIMNQMRSVISIKHPKLSAFEKFHMNDSVLIYMAPSISHESQGIVKKPSNQ